MTTTPPEGPTQAPTPDRTPAKSDESPRFAAYDLRYLRFVGAVVDTKAKAKDEAKRHGGDNYRTSDYEIREV